METRRESPSSGVKKRDFEESFGLIEPFHVGEAERKRIEDMNSQAELNTPLPTKESADQSEAESTAESLPTPPVSIQSAKREREREVTPAESTVSSLSDLGSRSTPSLNGGSPVRGSAFAALNGNANGNKMPPAKKAKLSFAEKEARAIEKRFKEEERRMEREKKEHEKQAQLEEKRKKDRERDEEKRKKEAEKEEEKKRKEAEKEVERKRKDEEKAAREEKKRLKDEEKRKKDEEKQRIEDEKKKKAASQKTLSSFFGTPVSAKTSKDDVSTSPASASRSMAPIPMASTNLTPSKKEISPYDKMFPAFFVQNGVRLAPINHFARDDERSQIVQSTIDAYILGNRSPGRKREFDAMELFHLSSSSSLKRGKSIVPVREIMAELSGNPTKPIDLTADSQNSQIKRTKAQLKDVPMKFLKFQEDVRPPYQGTYTHIPVNGISKLARNPMRRDLPNTNYDYDSEAEWIEDEDAEDLNSEGEEDEEGLDDAEDMDGFLDDENDDLLISRRAMGGIQGDLEPVSTGLCWEDRKKRSTYVKMMPFRMEFILDPKMKSIDPFSTQYWEPIVPPSQTGSMDPPRLPLKSTNTNTRQTSPSPLGSTSNNKVSNPNQKSTPLSFFGTPTSSSTTTSLPIHQGQGQGQEAKSDTKPKKYLPDSDLPAFKEAIQGSDLSKVGLVEVLKKKFPGRTGGAIKATLDLVARRVGGKEAEKRWVLV
ncbi:hypothetical protein BELL_0574g00020 [Botrytis elliptica]|uniref:Chromatin assembly factor 1 subunit p150 C-terminal domain-containing protein n=1 Tax=Botrytis elliptica TaxID=278938 RepID=A0A4Z1JCN2_9HELO|nr:hypothetical protein EAE99_003201 [Botrytis elliptica]TGO71445.1 hypothetical protein BELL_0574g00020 [Botrytis elliptica]